MLFPISKSNGFVKTTVLCRVTRRVGSDGLLVAWSTPQDDELTGFQVGK
jgi:hypothetical protein